MNTYKIRAQPTAWATSEPTQDVLAQLLDAKLREVVRVPEGGFHVALERHETDHVAAFKDVFVALQQIGYQAIEADVTEWVDQMVESAIVGGLGGGTLASGSESGELMLFAALFGALAGALAGSQVRRVKGGVRGCSRAPRRLDAAGGHTTGPCDGQAPNRSERVIGSSTPGRVLGRQPAGLPRGSRLPGRAGRSR
jgi:hypothetical protein